MIKAEYIININELRTSACGEEKTLLRGQKTVEGRQGEKDELAGEEKNEET